MEITQSTKDLCQRTVGEVVAEDYRRAEAFEKFGIDFCCGGDKTVAAACEEKGVACDDIMRALVEADQTSAYSHYAVDVRGWPLDFLADYIVKVHHDYVRKSLPPLQSYTHAVARAHGTTNPETIAIETLFDELAGEFLKHMDGEEQILFPYIERLCAASKIGVPVADTKFGSVNEPVQMMEGDHDHAGEIMHRIRALSGGYVPPETACNTYRLMLAKMEEFEADLHRHVHLENNVLFPAAIRMEAEMHATLPA